MSQNEKVLYVTHNANVCLKVLDTGSKLAEHNPNGPKGVPEGRSANSALP